MKELFDHAKSEFEKWQNRELNDYALIKSWQQILNKLEEMHDEKQNMSSM